MAFFEAGDAEGGPGHGLLFEVEHAVEKHHWGRPLPMTHAALELRNDLYRLSAEAAATAICELMFAVEYPHFSLIVNRRIWQGSSFKGKASVFPEPLAQPLVTDTEGPGPTMVPKPPPPGTTKSRGSARGKSLPAARYPRPGAFEVSVYDAARGEHRLLFSKYHTHRLPQKKTELWVPLLPFLCMFAGYAHEEGLLHRLATFGREQGVVVNLRPVHLQRHRRRNALLEVVAEGLDELELSLATGSIEKITEALEAMPYNLRSVLVVEAEVRVRQLEALEAAIDEALTKIENGLVTSGVELLKQAVMDAKDAGLTGNTLDRAVEYLALIDEGVEAPVDLFSAFDVNGDGSISREEFETIIVQTIQARTKLEMDKQRALAMAGMVKETSVKEASERSDQASTPLLERDDDALMVSARTSPTFNSSPSSARKRKSTMAEKSAMAAAFSRPNSSSKGSSSNRASRCMSPDGLFRGASPDALYRSELEAVRQFLRDMSVARGVPLNTELLDEPSGIQKCLQGAFDQYWVGQGRGKSPVDPASLISRREQPAEGTVAALACRALDGIYRAALSGVPSGTLRDPEGEQSWLDSLVRQVQHEPLDAQVGTARPGSAVLFREDSFGST